MFRTVAIFTTLYLGGAVVVSLAAVAVMNHLDGRVFPY